jgi:Tfp pilus assembly protein PilN
MYRINLYPEYTEKRRRGKRRMLRTGLLAVIVALEAVLVVALIITGVLLGERAGQLRTEIAHLTAEANRGAAPSPEMSAALELLQVRQSRLEWAPKLAAVGDTIDPMLLLTSISARSAGRQGNPRFELSGVLRGTPPDMQAVPRFMDALRAARRVHESLPDVQLGTMEGGTEGRFTIVCQAPAPTEGS